MKQLRMKTINTVTGAQVEIIDAYEYPDDLLLKPHLICEISDILRNEPKEVGYYLAQLETVTNPPFILLNTYGNLNEYTVYDWVDSETGKP